MYCNDASWKLFVHVAVLSKRSTAVKWNMNFYRGTKASRAPPLIKPLRSVHGGSWMSAEELSYARSPWRTWALWRLGNELLVIRVGTFADTNCHDSLQSLGVAAAGTVCSSALFNIQPQNSHRCVLKGLRYIRWWSPFSHLILQPLFYSKLLSKCRICSY